MENTRPIRVQLSRAKGWRMPPNTVKVDRATKWGNPFRCDPKDPRGNSQFWAVEHFRAWVGQRPEYRAEARRELRGKDLACWCPENRHCHADVLLELASQ